MNELNFKLLFDRTKNHFFIFIKNEKILSISRNVEEILGFKEEELINSQFKNLFIDKKEYLDFLNYIKENNIKKIKINLKTKYKREKTFDILMANFKEDENSFFVVLKDITEDIKKEKLNQILFKLSRKFFEIKSLNELLKEIHNLLKEFIYAENFYVALIDVSNEYIYFPYFSDLKDEKPPPRKRRVGITEYVLEKGKGLLLKREEIEKLKDEGKLIFYGTCPESYVGYPLKVKDKFIGVIAIQSYDKNIIHNEDDLNLISFIGENISKAIEKLMDIEKEKTLIKNINGFIYSLILENQKFIDIEGKIEEITGYKKEDFIEGKIVFSELINKDDFDDLENSFKKLLDGEKTTIANIFRIITKGGEIKWLSQNATILRKEIPEFTIIQGIVTDITENVKTKEELYEIEKKFKRILDNSKDIIYRYTFYPERKFEYINEIVTEITGYIPLDHYNDPDLGFKILHPEDRVILEKVASGEIKGPVVLRWIRKDGKIIYTEQNNWYVKDDKGNVIAIEGIARDVTDKVLLENKLKESEKRFRLIFENSPIGITLTDKNGKIIYCNPKWEEIIGYKLEEIEKLSWMDLTYKDDLKEDLEKFDKLIKGELNSYSLEKRAIRKDGEVIWIYLTVVRVDDENGDFLYEIAMIEDITERKKIEIKLKESEERFRTIFEKSPLGIAICDREGKYILANETLLKIIGYTFDELKNISWKDYTHPEDLDKNLELYNKLINKEIDKFSIEKRYIRKDGKIVYVKVNSAAVFDDEGNFLYELSTIEDITDKKMLENALFESERKFRLFFEKNPLGVVIVDENKNFIEFNSLYLNLLGYSEDELKNLTWKDITYPDDYNKQEELSNKLINREIDSYEIEKRYIRKDGSIFWGKLFASAFFDENGKFIYSFGLLRDITEEKRLREELEDAHNKLKKSFDNILRLTTKIIEMRDPYTAGHQAKVSHIATKIAEKLNLPKETIESIKVASFLHDIGKMVVPFEVLNKAGKLTDNEFILIKEHSKAGYDILKNVEFLYPIAEIVYQHHERLDGSGYPRGLKNGEIMLEARIIAVADVFEAMTSHRPYRPKFEVEDALKELKEKSGILYDKDCVEALVEIVENNELNLKL